MKKVLAIGVVVLLMVMASVCSVFAADPVTMDFAAGATSDNTDGPNGFFGPYPEETWEMTAEDGVIVDMSVTEAWLTAEVSPQEIGMYKYAVVVAKADDVDALTGFTMSIGADDKNQKVGMLWQDWKGPNGEAIPMITTDFQTYVIDLAANNVATIVNRGPEFALNQGEAKGGKVSVKSVTFTDEIPADAVNGGDGAAADTTAVENTTAADGDTAADTTVAPTEGSSSSSNMGLIIGIIAAVVVVVVVVVIIIVATSKKK